MRKLRIELSQGSFSPSSVCLDTHLVPGEEGRKSGACRFGSGEACHLSSIRMPAFLHLLTRSKDRAQRWSHKTATLGLSLEFSKKCAPTPCQPSDPHSASLRQPGPPSHLASVFTWAFQKQQENLHLCRRRGDVANVSKLLKHPYSGVDAGRFPFSLRTQRGETDVDSHKPDFGWGEERARRR